MGDHFRLSLVLPHSILSLLCSKTLTVKIMRKMLGYMCMLNYMYVGKQSRHISMCACLWYGHKALRLTCKIHLTFLYLFVTEIKTLERLKYERLVFVWACRTKQCEFSTYINYSSLCLWHSGKMSEKVSYFTRTRWKSVNVSWIPSERLSASVTGKVLQDSHCADSTYFWMATKHLRRT